jgi:glycosyltransferase involved in cell wall biosynthesis
MGKRLLVLHVMEAIGGGTQRSLQLQVTNLDKGRFEVEIAIPPESVINSHRRSELFDAGFGKRIEESGYRVHRIAMRRGPFALAQNLAAAASLSRLITRRRYDIVHCHSAIGGAVGRVGARLASAPSVLYQPHGLPFNEYLPPGRRQTYLWLERLFGEITDVLIAVSPSERDQAVAAGIIPESRIRVIANPVDTDAIHYDEGDAVRLRSEYSLPSDAVIIGTATRFVRQKGIEDLVAAMPRIVAQAPVACLVIAGDGRLRGKLEAQARQLGLTGRVKWLGIRDDSLAVISSFDIFVQPSLWEGLPYAPLEAMLLRRPVVATDVTGTRDVIESDRVGVLVPPRNPAALAEAIVKLIYEPERRLSMGRLAELSVRQRFGVMSVMNAIAALYEEMAGHRPAQATRR